MKMSIENIWKEGFTNENLVAPKIVELYNKKSISIVENVIKKFKKEIVLLLPLGVLMFFFNIWLDNDNAGFWGLVSAIPCVVWFFIGKNQLKAIKTIDYKSNSFQYLVSIRKKLETIRKFNKRLTIYSVPIILFPMLIYTYYNQYGKSLGEIFGVENLNWPTISIFLMLPLFTLGAMIIAELLFRSGGTKKMIGIDSLINEMKELSQ